MRRFRYRAVSGVGDVVSGELEAESRAAARQRLRDWSLDPLRIDEGGRARLAEILGREIPLGGGRALRTRRDFAADLAVLRRAGAPLDQALSLMASGRDATAAMARRVLNRTAAGQPLSRALAAEGGVFDAASVALVAAGEASGNFAEALETLAATADETIRMRAEVLRALLYPAALVLASLVAIGLVVFHVLPNFERLFRGAGAQAPGFVPLLFELGAWLRAAAVPLLALGCLAVLGLVVAAQTAPGRRALDHALLALPLLGRVIAEADLARACLVAGRLIAAGTPADAAIELAGGTCRSATLADGLRQAAAMIRTGRTVAEALATVPAMPRRAVDMVAIGESAGSLPRLLEDAAGLMRRSSRAATDTLLAALPPVLTVVIGVVVAALVYAVLSVLLSLNAIAV